MGDRSKNSNSAAGASTSGLLADGQAREAQLRTLSRTDLYAPLSAWKNGDLLKYNDRKSQRLSVLADFVVDIGKELRQKGTNRKGSNDCRHAEILGQLKERQLSLIGGGIVTKRRRGRKFNKQSATATNTGINKRRARHVIPGLKPLSNAKRKKLNKKSTSVGGLTSGCVSDQSTINASTCISTWETLERINKWWNEYILSILKKEKIDLSCSPIRQETMESVSRALTDIEMVGSLITVESCASQGQLVGAKGIIVCESKNTLTLVSASLVPVHLNQHDQNPEARQHMYNYKIRMIPKGEQTKISFQTCGVVISMIR